MMKILNPSEVKYVPAGPTPIPDYLLESFTKAIREAEAANRWPAQWAPGRIAATPDQIDRVCQLFFDEGWIVDRVHNSDVYASIWHPSDMRAMDRSKR